MAKLIVKDENIYSFEVELDDSFRPDALTQEQVDAINAENAKFMKGALQPLLLSKCEPCQCRMAEIQQRIMARMKLLAKPPAPGMPVQMELLQEDVDAWEFGVVLETRRGIYSDILTVITRCKMCSTIKLFGKIEGLTYAIASGFTTLASHDQLLDAVGATGEAGDEFMVTDLDTGKDTECTGLGEALFGEKDEGLSLGSTEKRS